MSWLVQAARSRGERFPASALQSVGGIARDDPESVMRLPSNDKEEETTRRVMDEVDRW